MEDQLDLAALERQFGALPEHVTARHMIYQSPLCDDPNVPKGTQGRIVDRDYLDSHIYVDFGSPFGVVLCDYAELV